MPDLDALRIVPREVPEADVQAAPVQRAPLVLLRVEAVAGVLRILAAGFAVGILDLFQSVRLRQPGQVQGDDPLPFEGFERPVEVVAVRYLGPRLFRLPLGREFTADLFLEPVLIQLVPLAELILDQ